MSEEFNIEDFGATDDEVTKVKINGHNVEYYFDPEGLTGDFLILTVDDATALAKHFKITQDEIEGFDE